MNTRRRTEAILVLLRSRLDDQEASHGLEQ